MKANVLIATGVLVVLILSGIAVALLRHPAESPSPSVGAESVVNELANIQPKASAAALTNQAVSTSASSRRERRVDHLTLMKEALDLSDEQAKKLEPVLEAQHKQLAAFRRETSLSRAQRMARLKEMHDTNDAQLKSILTPEQFEKWRKRGLELQKALQTEVGSK